METYTWKHTHGNMDIWVSLLLGYPRVRLLLEHLFVESICGVYLWSIYCSSMYWWRILCGTPYCSSILCLALRNVYAVSRPLRYVFSLSPSPVYAVCRPLQYLSSLSPSRVYRPLVFRVDRVLLFAGCSSTLPIAFCSGPSVSQVCALVCAQQVLGRV